MSPPRLPCRSVSVFAFRGNRAKPFLRGFFQALSAAEQGSGPDINALDCLFFAGHAGVSIDDGVTIYGYNPDGGGIPNWELIQRLQRHQAFPGVVRDDTAVFAAARQLGLAVRTFAVRFPETAYLRFQAALDDERRTSQYAYGFPNGDGDCNCVTWLERLGLPLLTGVVPEFVNLAGFGTHASRRFGPCV